MSALTSQLVCTLTKDDTHTLAEQIMNNLLGRQVDSNYMVRMYCIRGLGNMADIGENKVSYLVLLKQDALIVPKKKTKNFCFLGFSIFYNHFECHVGGHG